MKSFEYAEARTEADVVELLAEYPDQTQLLAGGTDLVGLLRTMVVTPRRVVNLLEVESMGRIERLADGRLAIGAVVHLDELAESPELDDYGAVTQAIRGIRSLQLLAQGTLGGELCRRPRCWFFRGGDGLLADGGRRVAEGDNRYHAILGNGGAAKFVSASRIAPALVALDAALRVVGPTHDATHLVPASDFYRTPVDEKEQETALEPGQFVSHVVLPAAQQSVSATYEVHHGEGPEPPLASASAALALRDGIADDARIVLGQVAPVPWVSPEAREQLVGRPVDTETALAAARAAVAPAAPLSDNQYKVRLAQVAVQRAILRAAGQETGGFD